MPTGIHRREHLTRYQNVSTTRTFGATENPSEAGVIAGRPGYTIYVQRVRFIVTTSAAQSITVRDDNTTPKVIATLAPSAAVGAHQVDFGDDGIPLTQGASLDIAASGVGVAGSVIIEAYRRPTGTLTPAMI